MPKAQLPTTPKGWAVALGAGVVGFIAGFLFIVAMTRMVGR